MRVAFYTLGCKVNQYETEAMADLFYQNGFDVVDNHDKADVYVINSCTVTSTGDKKARQAVRRFKRNHSEATVVLTGCFPQAYPDIGERVPEADIISGSFNRGNIVELVKKHFVSGMRIIEITQHKKDEKFESMSVKKFTERTRAFVKIQDGCDRYCSYCIIPTARGPIRSKPINELEQELRQLSQNGYSEVVLVGINLSLFGLDAQSTSLIDAIGLACSIDGIERVRLGSLEPELLTLKDIQQMALFDEFCPQFHLSVQSGSDATLRRMKRHYNTTQYNEIVENIRDTFDNSSITTDIMVGFPGETEEEFNESLNFLNKLKPAKTHVFPYSIRPGTLAADLKSQIPQHTKIERATIMSQDAEKARMNFLVTQVGRTEQVLFEAFKEGYISGYTQNYTPVKVKAGDNSLCGKIKYVKINGVINDKCYGDLKENG